jgi:hypothetical protein
MERAISTTIAQILTENNDITRIDCDVLRILSSILELGTFHFLLKFLNRS